MKKAFFHALCLAGVCVCASAAPVSQPTRGTNYQLSTHILDIHQGRPARGVPIVLFRLDGDGSTWKRVAEGITDSNGRIGSFLPSAQPNDGIYKLKFETASYFRKQGLDTLYPFVEVVFEIKGRGHYHIPITMSANGYATYRGN